MCIEQDINWVNNAFKKCTNTHHDHKAFQIKSIIQEDKQGQNLGKGQTGLDQAVRMFIELVVTQSM